MWECVVLCVFNFLRVVVRVVVYRGFDRVKVSDGIYLIVICVDLIIDLIIVKKSFW